MKLSAAIRKGIAMDGPQVFGKFFTFDEDGTVNGCCVMGAAALGLGFDAKNWYLNRNTVEEPEGPYDFVVRLISEEEKLDPSSLDERVRSAFGGLSPVVANDTIRLSREDIATKLEGVGL